MPVNFIVSINYKISAPQKIVVGSAWGAGEARIGIEQAQPLSPSFGTRGS
jgi:hypothetical protein